MKRKSIFVQIGCYRDKELNKTISDAIAKSSKNININFGVHNCYLTENEAIVRTKYASNSKILIKHSLAPNNLGIQRSRYFAHTFYDGEDYYVQIDAHMRFAKYWDEILINQHKYLKSCGLHKPLVTGVFQSYDYIGGKEYFSGDKQPRIFYFYEEHNNFANYYLPSQGVCIVDKGCTYTAGIGGAFIFTEGSFHKINPTKNINFINEEPTIAMRAFTHGFDLVADESFSVYHFSGYDMNGHERRNRAHLDFPELWRNIVDGSSRSEWKKMIDSWEIGPFGFGEERTLEEWSRFSRLNYVNKTVDSPWFWNLYVPNRENVLAEKNGDGWLHRFEQQCVASKWV